MKRKQAWVWPRNIAIAASGLPSIYRIARGTVMNLGRYPITNACAAWLPQDYEWSVWVSPDCDNYRDVWNKAVYIGAADPLNSWGPCIDVDHLLPRGWVKAGGLSVAYLRIFPVYQEVNRGMGAGIEKKRAQAFQSGMEDPPTPDGSGVWYAKAHQFRKILGLGA